MRMFSTCIYMQFGEDSAAKTVMRNHAFNGEFNHSYRVFGKHFTCGSEGGAAKIAAVTEISFLNEFFAGQNYFICIDYDYMISGIRVFHEGFLLLLRQDGREFYQLRQQRTICVRCWTG